MSLSDSRLSLPESALRRGLGAPENEGGWADSRRFCAAAHSVPASVVLGAAASLSLMTTCHGTGVSLSTRGMGHTSSSVVRKVL